MTKTSVAAPGNIGPQGRRQRLIFGTLTLAIAAAALFLLEQWGVSRAWRLLIFPLVWLGLVGVLQARARTCIAFAARGTCDVDAGVPEMTTELVAFFRGQAKQITRTATTIAVLLIVAALLIP